MLGCAIAAVMAAGTSAHAQGAKKREIIVWGIAMDANGKGQDAVIHEFERRHPDIKVRLLSMGAGNMDPQKLMTSIVGNVAPDIINQDRFTLSDWASRGAFRSLDDLIERDKNEPLSPKKEQYYPAAWSEAQYEGKIYGIPTGADDRLLYYNKKIFRESADKLRAAGCDPDRAPRTWPELIKYSRALTEWNSDGTLKRVGFAPNYGNAWLYIYAFENNASFMSADGRKCTLDTPPAEEALQFMVDGYDALKKDPQDSRSGYEVSKAFESGFLQKENDSFLLGKVAMKIDGNWILADPLGRYGLDLDFATAPPPVPEDRYNHKGRFANEKDQFITWIGGYSLCIPKGAKNPKDAWEYIKFATSTEGRVLQAKAQQAWEKHRGRFYVPGVSASSEANAVIFQQFRPADKKFADALKMHIDMMPVGRIRPATFVGQMLWNEHTTALETACLHKASPKDSLLSGQATVQRDLDAFYDRAQHPIVDLGILPKVFSALTLAAICALIIWFTRLRLGRLERNEAKWAYLFISPWVIGFLALTLGPMLASLFFSFTQYDVLNEARWVGFKNFADLFGADRDRIFKAFGNAVYLGGIGVPLGLFTGLSVALLLNTAAKGMRFYRTLFYIPAIVPTIASAVLWTWVLTPDANKGLINSYWTHTLTPWLGVAPPAWLQSADWSKNALIVQGIWGAGSGMLLWLAGLKGVSPTLYEASGIDGATPKQQFWKITFPQLSPIIFFNTVMGFIGAMQEFDRSYAMKPSSDGPIGPDNSMLTPVYVLFQNGFTFFKMGYASAIAWLIFAIIVALTFTQFRLAPKWVHYEAEK
ncbi:sugar ABC transporter permease [Fimbriimonas ginsengisoli Gsoil 348]|uniref:Sugar ABC transporter permease n=1 Tax=Fimbriimonas ginsengisoli Gsoil 348 TaxID=661478 RepID=A0A068NQS8_FIMGI|nr:sugar ABC transporter permease [Fimbriimonas ginsengisoli Gsoil 348]